MRWLLIPFFPAVLVHSGFAEDGVVVDLNSSDTYRAVFESGLRPRRAFREGVEGLLEIRPSKSIGFVVEGFKLPPIKAIWSFDVAVNDQVSVVRGVVEDAWTKAEAFEKVRPLELAFGGDVEALKKWIDAYPDEGGDGFIWGRRWRNEDRTRSVQYNFRHTMQDARPLTISISIELHWTGLKRGFRRIPLKPPTGFENADISFDETYGGTAALRQAPTLAPLPSSSLPKTPESKLSPSQPVNEPRSSVLWSVVVAAAILLVGLLRLLLKRRK